MSGRRNSELGPSMGHTKHVMKKLKQINSVSGSCSLKTHGVVLLVRSVVELCIKQICVLFLKFKSDSKKLHQSPRHFGS